MFLDDSVEYGRRIERERSAERDLALARAVAWEARYGPKTNASGELYDYTDAELHAIIAQVDASLGEKWQQAVKEDGERRAAFFLHQSVQAAEPPSTHSSTEDCHICHVRHHDRATAYERGEEEGKRAEQQRAAYLLRELLDATANHAVFVAARQYIAEAEAAQKGEG